MQSDFSPIFIVGSSRSGTTMMNRIIGSSEDVASLNELHFLGSIWDTASELKIISKEKAVDAATTLIMHIRRGFWDGGASLDEKEAAVKVIEKRGEWTYRDVYQEVLCSESGKGVKYITDQTPRNVYFVDAILENFPNARVIHMIRDPRAVLYSQRNRWRKKWLGGSSIPFKNAIRVLCNYHPYTLSKLWNNSAEIAKKHKDCSRYKVVRFEELVLKPMSEVNKICRFLGIDFQESMLLVPQVGSSHKTHDYQKKGISSDVVDVWQSKLPKGDIYICDKVVSEQLSFFGYYRVSKGAWFGYTLGSILRFPFHILGSLLFNPRVIYVQIKALVNLK